MLSRAQRIELTAHRESLNPAQLARQIVDLQNCLLVLAKHKTEQLYLASFPSALPVVCKGIRPLQPTRTHLSFAGSSHLRHGPGFAGILT